MIMQATMLTETTAAGGARYPISVALPAHDSGRGRRGKAKIKKEAEDVCRQLTMVGVLFVMISHLQPALHPEGTRTVPGARGIREGSSSESSSSQVSTVLGAPATVATMLGTNPDPSSPRRHPDFRGEALLEPILTLPTMLPARGLPKREGACPRYRYRPTPVSR